MAGNTRRLASNELEIFDKTTEAIQAEYIRQAEHAGIPITKDGRTRNLPSSKDTGRYLLNYHTKSIRHFVNRELLQTAPKKPKSKHKKYTIPYVFVPEFDSIEGV